MKFGNYAAIQRLQAAWKKDPLLIICIASGSVVLASKLLSNQTAAKKAT